MSTRIDISVAGDLLRRLNRSQQEVNRQGLQERERRASLTQRGTIARQEFNRSQGRGADGRLIGRRPLQPRFQEEPAAFRHGGGGFVVIVSYGLFGYENRTELFVSTPISGAFIRQSGAIVVPTQFTDEDRDNQLYLGLKAVATKIQPVAQIYSERGLATEQFLATTGGAAVAEWIRTQTCWPEWQTNRTILWNTAHRLEIGQGITATNSRNTSYRLAMRQAQGDTPAIIRVLTGVTSSRDFAVETPLFNYGVTPELAEEYGYPPGAVLRIDSSGNYDAELFGPNRFDRQAWVDPARLAADTFVYYQGEGYSCDFTP